MEKTAILVAFLPLLTVIYPETVAAAYTAQTSEDKALVFQVNSKQTPKKPNIGPVPEDNPTLKNPCYPAPIDSCSIDANLALNVSAAKVSLVPATVNRKYTGRTYTKNEVEALIVSYSEQYGIDPKTPKCIAFYESGYNQFSKNKRSTASGVFQYIRSTWNSTDEGKAGYSVFDADANVKAAVKYMAVHKNTKPWVVRGKCPALSFVQ